MLNHSRSKHSHSDYTQKFTVSSLLEKHRGDRVICSILPLFDVCFPSLWTWHVASSSLLPVIYSGSPQAAQWCVWGPWGVSSDPGTTWLRNTDSTQTGFPCDERGRFFMTWSLHPSCAAWSFFPLVIIVTGRICLCWIFFPKVWSWGETVIVPFLSWTQGIC